MKTLKKQVRIRFNDVYTEVKITPLMTTLYNAIRVLQCNLKRGVADYEIKEYLDANTLRTWTVKQINTGRAKLAKTRIPLIREAKPIISPKGRLNQTWGTTKLDWKQLA